MVADLLFYQLGKVLSYSEFRLSKNKQRISCLDSFWIPNFAVSSNDIGHCVMLHFSVTGGTLPNKGMDINDLIDPRPWNEKPVERLSFKEIEEHWDEFPPETREAIEKMLNREKEQFQKIFEFDQKLVDIVSPRLEKPILPSIPDTPHFSLPEAFAELQAALDKVLENQKAILEILREDRK